VRPKSSKLLDRQRNSVGSEFQTVGPATEKARRPNVICRHRGRKGRLGLSYLFVFVFVLVAEVYELMRDIDPLLLSLRGVKKSTRLLTLACCLSLISHHTGTNAVEMDRLRQSVAVARQHYVARLQHRQPQVLLGNDFVSG